MLSFFALYIQNAIHQIDLGKQFPISIEEGEVIDYNAVNEERIINGVHQHWFDKIHDTEREKLAGYMKKNNYIIVPGVYFIRYGYKFKDLQKVLEFEKIE